MTEELNKRINVAENFSTDLVHEIRNPLASLKGASEIISETEDKKQREKLINNCSINLYWFLCPLFLKCLTICYVDNGNKNNHSTNPRPNVWLFSKYK